MSLLKTIFKIPTKSQIAFLKLDASISETHKKTAKVTENEIEDGSTVSDHVKLAPQELTMECIVSDTPISILGLGVSTDDVLGAANSFLDGKKNSFEGLAKNERRTPKEAWEYLNNLINDRTPFSVVTALQRYEDMILVSLSAPRTAKNGKDLLFTAELKEIRIVKSSTVLIPAFKLKDPNSSASSKAGLGKQSSKAASAAQTDNSSILLKGFKKAGILE